MGEDRTADEAFALLADPTRVDVLRAVARAQHDRDGLGTGPAQLGFSEIRDRIDVDSTSRLSYHLGELAGTFLRKRGGRYSLTPAGEQVVRFVLAEGYERLGDVDPREADGACPYCGETALVARLRDQFFSVECESCDRPVAGYPVTPAMVESDADLLASVARRQAADYAQIRRGTCPECGGSLSTEVREVPEPSFPDADPYLAVDACEICLRRYSGPLTYGVAYHPASVAFHWDRGVDVSTAGMWEFHEHLRAGRWTSERTATDPDAFEVVLRRGDDALRARLDAAANVTRTERVRASTVDAGEE
ncbi:MULTISPECIES: winged helix-turn-helix domain-containing protein [Halorussus]|uniref:winged helix-turn-helix domain-containing protein n=1 Tax=Halorussus TaxID=1070314 RepID=UPI000E211428|nr:MULTISPECIES: winged helix-turn-helix domain-containing protein [Halorussus]NHN60995.1 helix-turn-helix transcriptional regulator [Halorussus sp. JP-T4]